MGAHHQNPNALMRAAMPPKPKGDLGAQVHASFQKKETVLLVKPEHYREVEGKSEFFITKTGEESAWQPAPTGHVCKVIGQPLGLEDLDWVVSLISTCQHNNAIAGPRGETPVTVAPLMELYRADARAHIASHESILAGPQEQPEPRS